MKLSVKKMSFTFSMFFAITIFWVGLARLVWPDYGQPFAELVASLYPGYTGAASFGQMIIGTLYGALDGAIAGAVFSWLYNCCSD